MFKNRRSSTLRFRFFATGVLGVPAGRADALGVAGDVCSTRDSSTTVVLLSKERPMHVESVRTGALSARGSAGNVSPKLDPKGYPKTV